MIFKNEMPLVSIVVISYNAEKYIYDTLNSITNQSYPNLELIISDDCSNDATVKLCRKWLVLNGSKFIRHEIVSTDKNRGVVFNLNNGCRQAAGKWIKLLSGDDLLPDGCIEKYMNYIIKNNISNICCAKRQDVIIENHMINIVDELPDSYTRWVFSLTAEKQFKKMLRENVILLPTTAFIEKQLYETLGYYDESFPEIEDQPFMLKIAKSGIKINYTDSFAGYMYRKNIDSISQCKDGVMNEAAFKVNGKLHRMDKKYVLPYIKRYDLIFYWHYFIDLCRRYIIIEFFKNKRNYLTWVINRAFLAMDPIFLKKKLFNVLHR